MNRRQRQAEQSAAWTVMRSDRRFLWLYAGLSAACSLAGNLGHAWVTRASGPPPLWVLYGWATVPVLLLVLSAYAKPTLARMLALGRSETADAAGKDRLSSLVVWAVFAGAFVWSAHGIYLFTVALGVPESVAWIAPATIDVSLFGALRGLVLTDGIAARMKAGLEPAPAPAAPAAPAKPRPAAAPTAAAPTAAAPTTSTGAAPTTSVAAAPAAAPAASAASAASAPVIAAAASPVQHDRAAAIAASGVTAKSVDDVAAVLQLLDAGASDRGVHAETGVDARTVAKIRKAAAEPEPTRTLTTV